MATLGNKLVDQRIVERNIEKGLISKEEYEQHLANLVDREGEYVRIEIDPGDSKAGSSRE